MAEAESNRAAQGHRESLGHCKGYDFTLDEWKLLEGLE